jgi:hypothetical protein
MIFVFLNLLFLQAKEQHEEIKKIEKENKARFVWFLLSLCVSVTKRRFHLFRFCLVGLLQRLLAFYGRSLSELRPKVIFGLG